MTYIYQGDRVILPTGSDPAIERVPGHHRYHIGLDLGQNDPTAIVIIADKRLPEWASTRTPTACSGSTSRKASISRATRRPS